jgi:very-short-patch-repair endonuclease
MSFLRNDPQLKVRRRELRRHQTDAERVFWTQVRGRNFHGLKFFRQYSIGSYILDFYCPTVRLAIELDGGQHNQPEGREYDEVRSEFLRSNGITVVRFWNHEVLRNMEGVWRHLEIHPSVVAYTVTPPDLPFSKGEEKS